jgi:hypothetical protein
MKRMSRFLDSAAVGVFLIALSTGSLPAQALPITSNFNATFDGEATANGPSSVNAHRDLGESLQLATTNGPTIGIYTGTPSEPAYKVSLPTDTVLKFRSAIGLRYIKFTPVIAPAAVTAGISLGLRQ